MISYMTSLDGITADHLRGGFFVGWARPLTPLTHLRMLHGSAYVVLALDEASDQVVGYITALTDGVLAVFISNIEVLPAYKGQGIGTELMRRLLEQVAHLPNIDLMCDEDVKPFYARLGMIPLGGMALRRFDININKDEETL